MVGVSEKVDVGFKWSKEGYNRMMGQGGWMQPHWAGPQAKSKVFREIANFIGIGK